MRLFVFSLLCLVALPISASEADSLGTSHKDTTKHAATHNSFSKYDKRTHQYRKHWDALIPEQIVIQNAGNMGAVSMGIGWDYGRHRQWETHLLWGFLPKHQSTRAKLTMTIKENYIPWSIAIDRDWNFEPLTCGLYVNTVFGHEFWERQPSRYPEKYYDFLSTKARFNVFLGQRVTMDIPQNKRRTSRSLTLFYEVSTCDLYLRALYVDHYIKLKDILGLSLGLKIQLL